MKIAACLAAALSLAGCRRYADFQLPQLSGARGRPDWKWTVDASPVLPKGGIGDWDGVDALNPSVIEHNGEFLNLYSGYDGKTWHTGLSVSRDGIRWIKRGKVLSPDATTWEGTYIAANGSVLAKSGDLYYWYQAGIPPRIGLARSKNGVQWSKLRQPVLDRGPRGSWDERGVADPYLVQIGDSLYMYYLGQDRARRQRLGVARSLDGIRWQKLRSNPVLELGAGGAFDELGLGEPAVWQEKGSYWMLYTGRDRAEHRRLGLARSQDGVHWSRLTESAVLSGKEAWNSQVICDPTVLPGTKLLRVWFGGGNRAQPAENLNGQIGYATLELTLAE